MKIRATSKTTKKSVILNALIDSGATNTISTFEVAEKLGIGGTLLKSTLRGATGAMDTVYFEVDMEVQNISTQELFPLKHVRCYPKMDWRPWKPYR